MRPTARRQTRTRAEAETLGYRTVFDTPTDADRLELDHRTVGDIAKALLVFDAAGQVDQPAEPVLWGLSRSGFSWSDPGYPGRN